MAGVRADAERKGHYHGCHQTPGMGQRAEGESNVVHEVHGVVRSS